MDKVENNILDISHNHYKYLINLKNVTGVGLGFKTINEILTKEPCIHVLVEKKLKEIYLTKNNIIPKTYMGIKTDVIESGKFIAYSGIDSELKLRPLQGGCSIGMHYFNGINTKHKTGTLGCIVTKKKNRFKREYFILSCNHVIADFNDVPLGMPILQPKYGWWRNSEVAYLSNFFILRFSNSFYEYINYADAAIAKITKKSLVSNKILNIGPVKGVNKAKLGLEVKKFGSKTGLTKGKITTIGLTQKIYFGSNYLLFLDVIVSDMLISHGDSGSCVLNNNNEVIGLIHAGNGKKASMNDINVILEHFKVEMYTGKN